MKRKITRKMPDGSMHIIEEDDQAPEHHKNELAAQQQAPDPKKQYLDRIASQGHGGDTKLAHVNPWEEALLKRLGGAGTRNPHTGLKQFTNPWQPSQQAITDYNNYFSDAVPGGTPMDWAGGSIVKNPDNTATYTNPTGGTQSFNSTTPLATIYNSNPAIAAAWDQQYGKPQQTDLSQLLNFPLDIMPTSGSTNVSGGTNNSTTSGGSSSQNNSSNYSGLPAGYQEALLNAIIPQLTNATNNMEGNYDKYTNQALGSYQQVMNNALKTNIPAALRNMADRGIINSTEGQGVLGNVMSSAAMDASNKGYQTAMQAALLKANMPTILAQLADLGKTSYGASSGSTSGWNSGSSSGTTSGSGSSYSEDPTTMYRTMADLISGMMG